ncbi:MAG: NAD(P)/FAD-dependent oxidoreductase [Candidatus Omnitrophica bacterium]|nr:NAD(P)/FAD-dependent oxidoreductase [Candidatus Omnitrophota bacterium]
MSKLVIIGDSFYAHSLALKLREKEDNLSITLVSKENQHPYDHSKLVDFLNNSISEEKLFFCQEDLYKEKNINLLKDREITGMNTTKRVIYFKNKDRLEYDFLVIATDRIPKFPDIPGIRKKEVYNFYFLDEVKRFLNQFIMQPVCLVGSDDLALRMAKAVAERFNTEVKLVGSTYFNKEINTPNIEVINSSLVQIIGEGEVQAVKLKEGKVIAVSAVLFMDNYRSDIEFLKGTEIYLQDDYILVDEFMQTNIRDIFAIGSITNRTNPEAISILTDSLIHRIKEGVNNYG